MRIPSSVMTTFVVISRALADAFFKVRGFREERVKKIVGRLFSHDPTTNKEEASRNVAARN